MSNTATASTPELVEDTACCHNLIFTPGIFSSVGTQNEAARTKSAWSDEGSSHQITSKRGLGHISQDLTKFDQAWPSLTGVDQVWPRFDQAFSDPNGVHYARKPSKRGPGYIS